LPEPKQSAVRDADNPDYLTAAMLGVNRILLNFQKQDVRVSTTKKVNHWWRNRVFTNNDKAQNKKEHHTKHQRSYRAAEYLQREITFQKGRVCQQVALLVEYRHVYAAINRYRWGLLGHAYEFFGFRSAFVQALDDAIHIYTKIAKNSGEAPISQEIRRGLHKGKQRFDEKYSKAIEPCHGVKRYAPFNYEMVPYFTAYNYNPNNRFFPIGPSTTNKRTMTDEYQALRKRWVPDDSTQTLEAPAKAYKPQRPL